MSEPGESNSSESHVEKCPKCGGEMKSGSVTASFRILKSGDLQGDKLSAFYCRDCGFIELYKEPSTKEPWRWPEKQQAPLAEREQPSPETKKKLVK